MSSKKDRGWEYLSSGSDENFDYDPDNDGSWGFQNEDGSGSYYGNDGSWGFRNSDGSGSYYGADGSWGFRNSDGSSSYYGNDGSWGYRNSDGSGSFYGADGDSEYYDANENDPSDSSSSGTGAEAIGTLLGLGFAAYVSHKSRKEQKRQEEERKQEERLRREAEERIRKRSARVKRAKRAKFYKKHWLAILIVIALLIGGGYGYFKYTEYQKSIEVGISSTDLIGTDHSMALKLLEESGFTNIHETAVSDLGIQELNNEGIVTEITIRGDSSFGATSRYPYDARINITYHLVKNITVPVSSKAAKKQSYEELETQFLDAGFVNVRTEVIYDIITGWITKDGSVESISVDGDTDFIEYASYRPDVEVIITYHTFKKNQSD